MARRVGREEAYAAAERFVEEALKSDGSLFTPGTSIWSAENIEDLYERFVGNPDESSDSFEDKFRRQLEGAPLETRQLAAELLYIYLLFPSNIRGESKRRIIQRVLDGTSIRIPHELDNALDHGIASFGPALQNRPWQLWMLLEFFREWKTSPNSEEALSDPWRFKEIVFSVPHERSGVQCEALLHLVHPNTFEHTVSQRQKRLLVERFRYLTDEDTADVDRRLLEIREKLTATYGEDFDFHDEEMKNLWLREENEWDAFVRWARKFYEWDGFDENERNYKLEVAARLEEAKDALFREDSDWTKKLKKAFGPPNNLAHWRQSQPFLKWCEMNTEATEEALRALWNDSAPILERIRNFSELLPKEIVSGRGGRLALASVLLLTDDPLDNPIYRAGPLYTAKNLLKYPLAGNNLDEAGLYEQAIEFIDRFLEEADSRGLKLRDRLDGQSVIWCVSKWSAEAEPVSTWPEKERKDFLTYRGEEIEDAPWWKPLEYPPGLEFELQRILVAGSTEDTRELLGAIFRRAILLHQRTGTEGFLGARARDPRVFSVMVGNLYSCVAGKRMSLLVEDRPHGREAYEVRESGLTDDELVWAKTELEPLRLRELLEDEELWAAYEQMLRRFPSFPRAQSNRNNVGKMSVLTGERLGSEENEDLETLARELFLDHGYPSRVDRLLRDKRQIIFYGPPGTGKTFVARKLARLYGEGSGGSSLLVQFHPSYSYEDFVEGYRPRSINGQPGFTLVDGPLKKLAREARDNPDASYVLVIDEVNRANLTKVMGELYFLLEYRGESVSLQYSEKPFALPENLWIICTMNTADRSIALVDAALRRRFYFAPFFPDEAPVEGLLRRWLMARIPSLTWVADVVDEANRKLDDRDAAIGPSYFLREDLTTEWVGIIWEHAVIPYLAEQMMDEEERLKEFDLGVLRAATSSRDTFEGQDEAPNAS